MRITRANLAILVMSLLGLIALLSGCASQSAQKANAPAAAQPEPSAIAAIVPSESPEGTRLVITADKPLTFSSLKQPDPLAVVLYFPNTSVSKLPAEQEVGGEVIRRIISRGGGNGTETARVEVQLAQDVPYTVTQNGDQVELKFGSHEAAAAAAQPSAPPAVVPVAAAETSQPAASAPAVASPVAADPPAGQAKAAPKVPAETAWVKKIDFMSETGGKSTLAVGTTHPINYRMTKAGLRKLELHLLNTNIPTYRQRPLITTRFVSAVDRITPLQASKDNKETVITVELRESVPYYTEQLNDMLLVHFDASSIPPRPMDQAQLPAWKQAMNAEAPLPAAAVESSAAAPSAAVASSTEATGASASTLKALPPAAMAEQSVVPEEADYRSILEPARKHYVGEKIALDFYDTDIKNVFRILREVSGKNFAIDKDCTGKVTMTLDEPVPWDQILDLVLRMNQLGMSREGDIIRIATLETLKKEEDLRKAKLEAMRKAHEEVKALEPLVTRYFPVSYCTAKTDVMPHIEKILTKDRGSVTVDDKNNQVIVTDTAAVVRQAGEIIRRIDKVTSQVMIEARIVEVSSNFSRELGIAWNMNFGPGLIPGIQTSTSTDWAMNFPAASSSSIGINFSRLSGVPFVLNAKLNALETTGDGKILSSPKILTLDNKKAKIKQGVEYPYLERDSSGGSSVSFKNIDLLLEVTPHVTPDDRISLIIYITKNDVAGITDGVPSVSTNEAQTELLVNDGDTVVIGGIIKSTENSGKNQFPLLGSIPILGWAFKNTNNKTQNNELLIFITPRIVQLEQAAAATN